MESVVYFKSEFFDGINSGFVFVLLIFKEILDEFSVFLQHFVEKKNNPSTYQEQWKNTIEGRSGDTADKSQRQFQK